MLAPAIDGELSVDQRLRLDRHLAECAECRAERDAFDALETALLSLPEPPVEQADVGAALAAVRARIASGGAPIDEALLDDARFDDARLDEERTERNARPRRSLAPILAFAGLAAATVIAVLLLRANDGDDAARPLGRGERDATPSSEHVTDSSVADAATQDGEPLAGAPSEEAQEHAPRDPDAVDPERLAAARAAIADALAAAFAGVPSLGGPDEIETAVRAFEARTAELAALGGDWPVLRIVQGHAMSADDALAIAAVRTLGARGDSLSAGALRDALDRPATAAPAVLALGELGEDGLSGLATALRKPELAVLARDHIVAVGGRRAAEVLGDALRREARSKRPADTSEGLLDALAAVRPCPVEDVLDLIADRVVAADDGHRALAGAPTAAGDLLELARSGRRPAKELLAAFAVVRAPEALPWIAAQATDRDRRDAAAACLAAYATADALDVLRDLHARGRAPRKLVVATAADLLARAPDAAVDLARRGDGRGEDDGARMRASELLELLFDVGTADSAPGLAALAFRSALVDEDRPWAALAVAELGSAADATALGDGVSRLGAHQELLAAAALLAATALGRPETVLVALDERGRLDHARADELVALCASASDEGTRAVTLFKVARSLRPHFDDPQPATEIP